MKQRLTILYSGRVQGVGFRATCARLAAEFQVTGRVCNLTDGRVELIAEGERAELINFRDRIAIEMQSHITAQPERWSDHQQAWATFGVAADKQT